MDISSARLIFFSPTETTAKILHGIAQGIQPDIVNSIDLTPPAAKSRDFGEMSDELVIIGSPVHGGRIPSEAACRLRQIRGNNTPAVIVVVYGNREYEDALLELRDIVTDLGFVPIAGGAFIGEHSYDSENTPIATGRPDAQDIEKAKRFGRSIQEKINRISTLDDILSLYVPGDFPYKERGILSDMAPITVETLCVLCGECAAVCPTAAITVGEAVVTDQKECIHCNACVKKCPTGARVWDSPLIDQAAKRLSANYHEPKEPQIYL